jgi:hypothetical protein
MAEPMIHEARDLEAMSPGERDELVREGIITNPEQMPVDLVERARDRLAARVAERDSSQTTQ